MEITIRIPDHQVKMLFNIVENISCHCDPFAGSVKNGKFTEMEEKEKNARLYALENLHIATYVGMKINGIKSY